MLKIKKPRRTPPSGFTHIFDDGFQIRESSLRQLKLKVRSHMRVNNISVPDNIDDIIEDELCKRNPDSVCKGSGPKRFFPTSTQVYNGTIAIIKTFQAKGDAFVLQEEADRRAVICSNCDKNTSHLACSACDKAKNFVLNRIKRRTKSDNLLKVCSVCGCYNTAQIHMSKDVLQATTPSGSIKDYPDHCWKKHLLENTNG